ncbi:MAG: hypothetical protein AAFV95_00975 [Bacteroidota bacterium]
MTDKDSLFHKAVSIVGFKYDEDKQLPQLIAQGLEINREDEYGYTLASRAVFGAINYDALYLLWKAGAKASTELIEEIFANFEKGVTPQQMYEQEKVEKQKEEDAVKLDFSDGFRPDRLQLEEVSCEITPYIEDEQDSELVLELVFEPFRYKDNLVHPDMEFIAFSSPEIEAQVFSPAGWECDEEVEGSSIYLENIHHPVDLKWLKMERGEEETIVHFRLFFDFSADSEVFESASLEKSYRLEQ